MTIAALTSRSEASTVAGGSQGGEGISINELMVKMSALLQQMRDMQQDYSIRQQELGYQQQVAALAEKRSSIAKNYEAASGAAIASIVGGVMGVFGSLAGGGKGMESLTQLGSMAGKTCEGIGQAVSADKSSQAQLLQTQGEFMSASADEYRTGMRKVADAAIECSRQMRETTQQLVDLHARLAAAVKFA